MSDNPNVTVAPSIAGVIPTLSRVVKDVGTFTADVAGLPDASIAYLLEYGFSQAIGDTQAIGPIGGIKAGVKAGVLPEDVFKEVDAKDATKALTAFFTSNPDAKAPYESFLAEHLASRAQDRLDAILAGEMVFGVAERLSPEEKDRREFALSILKDSLAPGQTLPKKAEELRPLLDYVYTQRQAEIDKEVARRAKVRAQAKATPALVIPTHLLRKA